MGGELTTFRLPSFQSILSTLYCTYCERIWAKDYEEPTCRCSDRWTAETSLYANMYDYMVLSTFYDGNLPGFWLEQEMPFYAFLMEAGPAWIDFP